MASKGWRDALLAAFGGGIASGAQKQIQSQDEYAKELGKLLINKQMLSAQQENEKQQNELKNRMEAVKLMQGYSYTDPQTGRSITVPGPARSMMDTQFPGLLRPDQGNSDFGVKKSGLIPQPAQGKSQNPESMRFAVQDLENTLKKIPTDVSTGMTAVTSNMLGGEREIGGQKIGSNDVQYYQSIAPGTAVGLYRALTGDTRLSDDDAKKRALPFLPRIYPTPDTPEVRQRKLDRLKIAIDLASQQKKQSPDSPIDFNGLMGQAEATLEDKQSAPQISTKDQEELNKLYPGAKIIKAH